MFFQLTAFKYEKKSKASEALSESKFAVECAKTKKHVRKIKKNKLNIKRAFTMYDVSKIYKSNFPFFTLRVFPQLSNLGRSDDKCFVCG
jgi:hypothetical protein